MESLNRMATELVDEALDFADELALDAVELDNGATVLDFGVEALGGVEAGLLLTEIQTAGLATLGTTVREVAAAPRTVVDFSTDHPALACLCAQKAGWELSVEGFEGLGSGPARALVAEEEEFARVGYSDEFDFAVLAVESDELPGPAVAEHVADRCDVPPSGVFLPTFPASSIVGSVQMAARSAELAAFRAMEEEYDPLDLLSVSGRAPVAPVAADEETAIARTNDALAYGASVHMIAEEPFDDPSVLASTAREDYGRPFAEVFEEAGWDFYEVPESVFAPARVTVDAVGGPTTAAGATDEALLAESFGLVDVE
jgi:methenyltetrahydromethanopterin cyclohydrolase